MEQARLWEILAAVEAAEREAGQRILAAGEHIRTEEKSGRRDVVTRYDREVQTLLTEALRRAVPSAAFFCEEQERRCALTQDDVFIIDPIDGTMNFVHGLRHSCVSVAYASGGEVLAGAVYDPYAEELFSAVKGGGARLNGQPAAAAETPLAESVVHFGTAPYDPALAEETFALAKRAFLASLDVRRRGSAALDLCDVAAGRAGLYFELQVSPWDYAAGALLVREAGGLCLTLAGAPLPLADGKTTILAGGETAVREFLALR